MYTNPINAMIQDMLPKDLVANLQTFVAMQQRQVLALSQLVEGQTRQVESSERSELIVQNICASLERLVQGQERVTAGLHLIALYLEVHLKASHPEILDKAPSME